jgi:hypothetical protein
VVGHVHAPGVVDRVRVARPAARPVLEPRTLREPEVPTLCDDASPEGCRVDADAVVGPVADVGVAFGRCLDVRPDAAVVEQVNLSGEDPTDHLLAGRAGGVRAEQAPHLRAQRDGLRRPIEDPASRAHRRGVVVPPRRARKIEKTLPLREAPLGIGVRVDEDVGVVERGDELERPAEEDAVAEDVSAHVSDAAHRDRVPLHVDPEVAEVVLDALPGAPSRDSDLLVIVADAAARGESVPEPEAVLGRDAVRGVREVRGPLVRSHDEVGVVGVVSNHFGRMKDGAVDQVVRDVEQA